jgi:DNA repair exonuclease SbcCD ATPase subunit
MTLANVGHGETKKLEHLKILQWEERMIVFQKVRWKNFLSTGNIWTEICLNDTANALIIGENGAGKSTILDALTFSLFGKPFRKINKPQLVNSVNEKGCVTEIEFLANNKNYKVIRGLKPSVFEIYCNDVCLNQDSASKDYQDHLEKFILKMNYKSFTQIVILGSASFTPFMQLSPADRRTVIEDLLDIQIFSVMNNIVKLRFQNNRDSLERNKIESLGKEEKKTFIEKTIASLKQNNEEKNRKLKEQENEYKESIKTVETDIKTLREKYDEILSSTKSHETLKNKFSKLIKLKAQITANQQSHQCKIDFYKDNNNCPTCKQSIAEDFKQSEVTALTTKLGEFDDGLSKLTKQIDDIISEIEKIDKLFKQANELSNDIKVQEYKLSSLRTALLEVERSSINTDNVLLDSQADYNIIMTEISNLVSVKEELLNEKMYIDTAVQLLKDGGIKTKIIKQYLPVINKLINKYLLQMGFFVNFNINESFEETIKSRYRDEFSYQNFSEGEKMRIDLALLFTWRAIAKMKNSVNTNLLILDEIFDGSLDANGTDEFLKIMWNMLGDSNVFVISHKQDQLVDKFKKTYKFQKTKNFSSLAK